MLIKYTCFEDFNFPFEPERDSLQQPFLTKIMRINLNRKK